VEPERFWNPIVGFGKMRLMKTTFEVKKDRNVMGEQKSDSLYHQIGKCQNLFVYFGR
jgi:hypothetical protein